MQKIYHPIIIDVNSLHKKIGGEWAFDGETLSILLHPKSFIRSLSKYPNFLFILEN